MMMDWLRRKRNAHAEQTTRNNNDLIRMRQLIEAESEARQIREALDRVNAERSLILMSQQHVHKGNS